MDGQHHTGREQPGRMDRAVKDVERRANSIVRLESVTAPMMDTLAGSAIATIVLVSGLSVGMGVAFLLGLCMDVDRSSLLGQHALAYALLVFAAGAMGRRLSWFSTPVQALHLLPLFAVVHGLQVLLRMVAGGIMPGPLVVVAPLIEALLWPLVSGLLLAPQRRPPDSDENRPL